MADTTSAITHSASSAIWNVSMPLGFKIPLRFDGGHASCTRSRNRLAIRTVLNVTRVEHARDIRARASMRNNVAVRIQVDLPLERLGIGDVADRNEKAAHVLL